MPFKIVRNDITQMNTEAIVNTANARAEVGTGCDSAVYKAAGWEELLRYRIEKIGFVPEGEAFITPGFHLKAKYIIHAVSPYYMGGDRGEEEKLRACYRNSLRIAKENHVQSIAFPLISTGGFGYPKEEGMRIAADEIYAFLLNNDMLIYLVVFDRKATILGEKLYPGLEAYIDQNYVENMRGEEYGAAPFVQAGPDDADSSVYLTNAGPAAGRFGGDFADRRMAQADFGANALPAAGAAPKAPGSSFAKSIFKKKAGEKGRRPAVGRCPEQAPMCQSREEPFIEFGEQHEGRLEERMKHISDTFSQYLMYLIQDKKMENAEVWKRAIVDKKVFSKMKNNPDYHPQKLTALCLCVGAKLNLDESRDLLARAGYALSPCDKTDIIFSYFIENEIYDMIELDIQLEEHGLPCIIS